MRGLTMGRHKGMNRPIKRQRAVLLLAALGLAVGVCGLLAAARPAAAADDGQPLPTRQENVAGLVQTDVSSADLQPLLDKAGQLRDRLKFPVGTRREARHSRDVDSRREYDEVSERASDGQMLSLIRFASDGGLMAAIRLDRPVRGQTLVSQEVASASAIRWASVAGLSVGKPNRTYPDPSAGGWRIEWDRLEDGIPVKNDGVVVTIWRDGTLAGIGRPWSQLGAKPDRVMDSARATSLAAEFLGRTVGPDVAFSIQHQELEWIQPNDTFDLAARVAGDGVMRLAWVVVFAASDADSDVIAVALYIDAGDGSLLGGDYVD
jgi:hypothetical protein